MEPHLEDGPATTVETRPVDRRRVAEMAADLTALVDRLEADIDADRASSPAIAYELHALRHFSERLFGER
jgi:hypothetical protein